MAVIVRWLDERDWEVLRDLRLRALADAPYAFTSTVERESGYPAELWQRRTPWTVVAFEGETPLGIASFFIEDAKAQLVGMWVSPEARGTGAADAIVHAIADRVAAEGYPLWLCVYVDNPRAKRFYERCGFVADGEMCDANGTRTLLQMTLNGSIDPFSVN